VNTFLHVGVPSQACKTLQSKTFSNILTKRSITAEVLRFFFASTHAMWNETYLHQTHKRPPRHVFMFWVVK